MCVCVQADAAMAKQRGKLIFPNMPPLKMFWNAQRAPHQSPPKPRAVSDSAKPPGPTKKVTKVSVLNSYISGNSCNVITLVVIIPTESLEYQVSIVKACLH